MKISIKKRISTFLLLLILLSALQYILVTISFGQLRAQVFTFSELRTVMLIVLLLQIFIVIILLSYLPNYLKRMCSVIQTIVDDISRGNYAQEIDLEEYRKSCDKELVDVVESMKKMLLIILKFDSMKKGKIQEQRGRIVALLNLTENGFMIVNRKGDIVYNNDIIKEHFPTMTEDKNIVETNFGLDIDNNIKAYVTEIIKTQSKNRSRQFYMASMRKHIALRSELVRDTDGNFIGSVIGIFNLSKKGVEKQKDREDKNSNNS